MSAPFAGGSSGPGQGNWGQSQQSTALNQSESGHHIPANLRPAIPPPGTVLGNAPPEGAHNGQPFALGAPPRDRQLHPSPGLDRQNSDNSMLSTGDKKQAGGSRKPSGSRVCAKCGKSLSGQFVRALDATYHLECFTCHVNCSHIL
jgi:LIM domain